ncbi:hypothetical protein [Mesorhizobium sp. M6A.T.Ce.TU.002.03.1.1]|uniref:hypothetical protein n=1 Tax=Mesorhizobium sp. M6A.T.Ce.TU.002.03.1.1 TaxID=2496782 RepID=UPI001FE0EDB9|nr:hypothetical protein [Mesorhizobium sp. M6A.T.Ce.TU.002.03.1.1]
MNAAKVSGGTLSNSYRLSLTTNHTERILLSGSYAIFRIEVDGMIRLDQKSSTIAEPVTFLRSVAREQRTRIFSGHLTHRGIASTAGTVFRVSLFYAGSELQPSNRFDRLG